MPEYRVAKRDWKKAIEDALEELGDRVRDLLEALDGLLAPPPQPVPVPIPVRPGAEVPPRR